MSSEPTIPNATAAINPKSVYIIPNADSNDLATQRLIMAGGIGNDDPLRDEFVQAVAEATQEMNARLLTASAE